MSEFRATLDRMNFPNPLEWRETAFVLGWQEDVLSKRQSITYTFTDEGYQYILGVYESSSCDRIAIDIYICDELEFSGLIFMTDVVINRMKCQVTCQVGDGAYRSFINNKRRQQYTVNVGVASDGTTITPTPDYYFAVHDVQTGTYESTNILGFRVYDVLAFLVRAMSNDTLSFASDLFDTGGIYDGYVIVQGQELRSAISHSGTDIAPQISWDDLYGDLKILFNLAIRVYDEAGVPTLRVEDYDYFRETKVSASVPINDLEEQIETDTIYATIDIGSRNTRGKFQDDPNTSLPSEIYTGFLQESYNVFGDCVTEQTLAIQPSRLVYDSNSIENALNDNEANDLNVFLIKTDGGPQSEQFDILGDGNHYYNGTLSNEEVLGRWVNRVHNSSFKFSADSSNDFEAATTADVSVLVTTGWGLPPAGWTPQMEFDNVISDPGGNYDGVTNFEYTMPITQTRFFTYQFDVEVTMASLAVGFFYVDTYIIINSGASYQTRRFSIYNESRDLPPITTVVRDFQINQTFVVTANIGDTIRGFVVFSSDRNLPFGGTAVFKSGAIFKSGSFIDADSTLVQITSEANLTRDQWQAIKNATTNQLRLYGTSGSGSTVNAFGNIKEITYNPFSVSGIALNKVRNN